jgi:hypothetical protein
VASAAAAAAAAAGAAAAAFRASASAASLASAALARLRPRTSRSICSPEQERPITNSSASLSGRATRVRARTCV